MPDPSSKRIPWYAMRVARRSHKGLVTNYGEGGGGLHNGSGGGGGGACEVSPLQKKKGGGRKKDFTW